MKKDCILINTSRGAVLDTHDLITALEHEQIGAVCLDVYENEKGLFFEDHTKTVLNDNLYARLKSFPNVLVTGHQAFLTKEALAGIASTTLQNIDCWQAGLDSPNEITHQ